MYYPKGGYEANGIRPIDFNGGYHTLASLNAAAGDADGVIRCFEMMKSQQDYFTDRVFNNYTNIIGYLYQYGFRARSPQLIKWISSNYPTNSEANIYRDVIIRSGYISHLFRSNFKISAFVEEGNFYPNLCLGNRAVHQAVIQDYVTALSRIPDPSERNFRLAMNFKRQALFNHKYNFDRGFDIMPENQDSLLDKAYAYFLAIDVKFLSGKVPVSYRYGGIENRTRDFSRRELFIYPDYLGGWLSRIYHSDLFLNYLKRKNRLANTYSTAEDLNSLHFWAANGLQIMPLAIVRAMNNDYPLPDAALIDILDFVGRHPSGADFDKNLLNMVLANRALERWDTLAGMKFYNHFLIDKISRSINKGEKFDRTFFANQQMELAKNLALTGKLNESIQVTEKFKEKPEQIMSYLYSARHVYDHNYDPAVFILLDSALSKMKQVDVSTLAPFIDFRARLVYLLDKIGGEDMIALGLKIMRDIPEGRKFDAIARQVGSMASSGNFQSAMSSIPSTLTESQDLVCLTDILTEACKEKEKQTLSADWKAIDTFFSWNDYVLFFGLL